MRLDIENKHIYIDGNGTKNIITPESKEADCVIEMSNKDFQALVTKNLNPMQAMLNGKLRIKGDMSIAMKLQNLFTKR